MTLSLDSGKTVLQASLDNGYIKDVKVIKGYVKKLTPEYFSNELHRALNN